MSGLTNKPDVTSPRVLRELFAAHKLSPRRQWGQNFLIDANIARKIVADVEAIPGKSVLEIGPGAGALTVLLAEDGYKVLALEVDRGLVYLLQEIFNEREEVMVKQADALKQSWQDLIKENFGRGTAVKLVSNLPYGISGPFLFSILKENFPFQAALLMLQKEVAQRLVALPGTGNYGALSVLCQYYTTGKILYDVSNNVFWPKPKVGSSVIRLLPRQRILRVDEEPLFWTIVEGVFRQRRKFLLNNLERILPGSREQLNEVLSTVGVAQKARAEELDVEQFAKLTRIIYNNHQ